MATPTKPALWLHPETRKWYAIWRQDGRPRRLSLRTGDRAIAFQKLDQFIAGLANPAPPKQVTVSEILRGYLKDRLPVVSSKATLQNTCNQIVKVIGNLAPEHISQTTANDYAKARHSAGVGDGTVIRELVTVRAALRWARREKWIIHEPEFRMPVRQPPPRDRYLTKEECRTLIRAATSPHIKLFLTLMLGTAARPGAILALTWDRVDFDSGIIDLGEDVGNKRKAVVPMNAMVRTALKEAWEVATSDNVIEYAGKPVKSIKTAFRKTLSAAEMTGVVPHTLRHTAATMMVAAGVAVAEVARMMGASEKMVEEVYGKHSPSYLKLASSALEL